MVFQAVTISPGLELGALIISLAVAVILHEVAHGYVALYLGDPTAKYAGRLTLNPLAHIDMWGTIIVPLLLIISQTGFVFGWAKPVPVNYFNLRGGKYGPVLVALAGPLTNLAIALVFGLLARFSLGGTALPFLFKSVAQVSAILMLFNLVPIPPLDGSRVLYLFLEDQPHIREFLDRYALWIFFAVILFGGSLLSSFVFEPATQLVTWLAGF